MPRNLNKAQNEQGPFAVLINNGFRYEYYTTVQARSAREAREIFKRKKDWRAEDFRVRDDRANAASGEPETIGDALAHGASADKWEAESPEETEARDAARLALHRDSGKPATALQLIASEPLKPASEEAPAPVVAAGAIDITPTWGEWGRIYSSFAESGERKVCRALREDFARAMAAAEVMRELRDTFTDEQAAIVARVLCDELRKQGF